MIPAVVNGQWRVVYDGRLDWVKKRGLAGKPCTDIIFNSWDDACSYIDKMEE